MSIIVEDLLNRFGADETVAFGYVYCGYKRQYEQKPVDLMSNLLKQLFEFQSHPSDDLNALYDRRMKHKTRPSLDEVSKVLCSVANSFSRVFILVDALDENSDAEGARTKFLSEIFEIQSQSSKCLSFLATSRPLPDIANLFARCSQREIRANEDDVQKYLNSQLSQLAPKIRQSQDLTDEITSKLSQIVNGMYETMLLPRTASLLMI